MSTILISYWPLLKQTAPGATFDSVDAIKDMLSEANEPPILGVLWVQDDGMYVPIFIMDRAIEVADHLAQWCENEYDRFKIYFDQRNNGYAVALIPDIDKSIDRWKLSRLMHHGDMVTGNDFVVVYKVLGTCCIGGTTYKAVKDKLGESVKVGFIDAKDVDRTNIGNTNFNQAKFLGPFNIGRVTDDIKKHMDELFDTIL